jgi:predicted alpha/beta superfamily hydrolase
MTFDFQPKPAETLNHDRFEVFAEGLGRYTIDVSLPAGYRQSAAKLPVILVTDGNVLFDIAQPILHGGLTSMGSTLPPSIVVGVGYPADEGNASYCARRTFDFYGPWAMTDPVGQALHQIFNMFKEAEGKPKLEIHAGGYDRFIAFLRDDLLPSLARHYPIDLRARNTLVGDSSGGHFVLRALYDPASPFRRYVCISPGFGCAEDAIQKAQAEYAASHNDLDADLFICCGRVEVDQDPIGAMGRFGSGVTWIAEQFAIRQWPSARVQWEIMNNEDHNSIVPRAIAAGLRSVHRVRPGVHDEELRKARAAMLEAMQVKG